MLQLDSVQVSLGGSRVLREVSLELVPGRTTLLLGRNGAGKTTTLRSIMGLLPLDSGRILLDEQDIGRMPAHRRAALGIGYAPEDRRMIADFSVEGNLLLPLYALKLPVGARRDKLAEVYDILPEVQQFRKRSGGNLSGGQAKMVALGRALIVATHILLLDEPFQGLAPALALDYAKVLSRVREQRSELALLVTESSPQLLSGTVDDTLYIERGEIKGR